MNATWMCEWEWINKWMNAFFSRALEASMKTAHVKDLFALFGILESQIIHKLKIN